MCRKEHCYLQFAYLTTNRRQFESCTELKRLKITSSVPKYKNLLIIARIPIHNFDYEYF
jgi:hypothetical protein